MVTIQNQSGRNPTRWDKTGVVIETRPHDQVVVKVDGSRRLTIRNRRFIQELNPRKTRLEDQFTTPERRRAPEGPWRQLTPSLPKPIEVVENQSMDTDKTITPAPTLQVVNVDETLPSDSVPTPHDGNMATQQLVGDCPAKDP